MLPSVRCFCFFLVEVSSSIFMEGTNSGIGDIINIVNFYLTKRYHREINKITTHLVLDIFSSFSSQVDPPSFSSQVDPPSRLDQGQVQPHLFFLQFCELFLRLHMLLTY